MKKKIVSIFSGIDCLGLGFREFFDTVLAVEEEKYACETLVANKEKFHPNMEVLNADIFTIPDSKIEEYKGVTGLIGGPPCQAFSRAKGSYDPDDIRIKGIPEYIRWVRIIDPKFFMFENVKAITDKDKKDKFDFLINELKSLGYSINYSVLNSHNYGNAQNRERMIIVGFKSDLDIDFKFPKPTTERKYLRDILDEPGKATDFSKLGPKFEKLMPYVPEGGNWRDLPTEELIKLALGSNYNNRKGGMTGVCRRLHRDKPCPTITTSPNQNTTLMVHPFEDRFLSVEECRRGQGIPDDYQIIGPRGKRYKFIGNGVPVEMANAIAKSIHDSIFEYEYKNKEELICEYDNKDNSLNNREENINKNTLIASSFSNYSEEIEKLTCINQNNQIMFNF